MSALEVEHDFLRELKVFEGREIGPAFTARDPVNLPMIRHWCDAIGDRNPVYTNVEVAVDSVHGGIVAPPTMLQSWTMKGLLSEGEDEPDALIELLGIFDAAGFTAIVATNCEQTYERYLRPGDVVTALTRIDSISEEKKTGLGTGHFITLVMTYTDQDAQIVGTQMFRLLKFRPTYTPPPEAGPTEEPRRPRPAMNQDTAFFWEGVKNSELLIQRCASCGELRHPPRPMCPSCNSLEWDSVRSSGRGRVYSYVVHHHPPIPPLEAPYIVALVELEEKTRLVANLVGLAPEDVRIDMPVEVAFEAVDDELTLPFFKPVM
jgi:uncharacterized OB-fold protein/acyl dehydratase